MPYKCTIQQIADSIVKNHGLMTKVARELGMAYTSLCDRMRRSPQLQEIKKMSREITLDEYEEAMHQSATKDRNITAMIFYLKCFGGERGWKEKTSNETIESIDGSLKAIADKLPG